MHAVLVLCTGGGVYKDTKGKKYLSLLSSQASANNSDLYAAGVWFDSWLWYVLPWQDFCGNPQSLQVSDCIVTQDKLWSLPPWFFQVQWCRYIENTLVCVGWNTAKDTVHTRHFLILSGILVSRPVSWTGRFNYKWTSDNLWNLRSTEDTRCCWFRCIKFVTMLWCNGTT